jgi:hypothetical protein
MVFVFIETRNTGGELTVFLVDNYKMERRIAICCILQMD